MPHGAHSTVMCTTVSRVRPDVFFKNEKCVYPVFFDLATFPDRESAPPTCIIMYRIERRRSALDRRTLRLSAVASRPDADMARVLALTCGHALACLRTPVLEHPSDDGSYAYAHPTRCPSHVLLATPLCCLPMERQDSAPCSRQRASYHGSSPKVA